MAVGRVLAAKRIELRHSDQAHGRAFLARFSQSLLQFVDIVLT
jgi:hypothetical protein